MENKNLPTLNLDDSKVIATLKATVAKDLTNEEFALFAEHAKSTGLNPFKKEIWAIKAGGRLQLMVGINGFYEIANRHPQFDGIEVETVESNGKLIKAVAKVYRKDRSRPTTAEAYLSEYGKPHGTWQTMPRVMLSKCAESMALRKSFPQELNGIYTDAEMPREYASDTVTVTQAAPAQPAIAATNWTYYSGSMLPEAEFQGFVKFMRDKNCINVARQIVWKSPVKLRSKKLDALEISEAEANEMIAEMEEFQELQKDMGEEAVNNE